MAKLTKNEEYIVDMYVRYFGKAPSVAEIAKYNDFKTPKLILKEIIGDADDSKATLTTKEFVNNAFQNLFGRNATTKEMNKYSKVVDAGKDLPINAIVKAAKKSDKGVYEAKKAIAIMLAEDENTTNYNLDKITKDTYANVYNLKTKKLLVDSVAQLKTKIDAMPDNANGQTLTLTDSIDNITGTNGNDTIIAGASTLNAGDQINGGSGTDTLKIYDGLENLATAKVSAVEIIESYDNAQAVNVSTNVDVKEIWLNAASTNAATATKTQVIGFGDAAGGAAAVATFTDTAGTADAATISVKDAGKTTAYTSIAVAGIESLTIDATGSSKLGNLIAAAAETIIVKGTGSVTATLLPATTVLKTVDATANTGGVTLSVTDAQFGANEIKVSTGTGNDSITFTDALGAKATIALGAGDNTLNIVQGTTALTAGSTFVAGAGTKDTLVLTTTTTAINATSGKMFTGFENIKLAGTTSSYKVGDVAGITGYEIAATTAGTLTNMAEATTVKVSANSTTTLTLADNSLATSSVKVVLDNGLVGKSAGNGVATALETNAHILNIESVGNVNTTINAIDLTGTTASLAQITNIMVTGDQAAKVTTDAATALTLIDGSAATGKLTINTSSATKAMTVKGGTADDTITVSDVANAISTITGGKGADKITLGSTAANNKGDIIKLTAQTDSTATAYDIVNNFAAATTTALNADKIDVSSFSFAGAQKAMFTLGAGQVTASGSGAATTFAITDTAAKDFFANAGVDKGIAIYVDGTNSAFAFIDADKNGDWNASTDSVILLVGNYGTDLITVDNFIL